MAQPVNYDQLKINLQEYFATLEMLMKLDEPQMKSVLSALQSDASAGLDSLTGRISREVQDAIIGKKGFLRRALNVGGTLRDATVDSADGVLNTILMNPGSIVYGLLFGEDKRTMLRFASAPAQREELARVVVDSYKSQNEGGWAYWGRLKDVFFTTLSLIKSGNFSSLSNLLGMFSYVASGNLEDIGDASVKTLVAQNQGTRVAIGLRSDIEAHYATDPAYGSALAKMVTGMRSDRRSLDFVPLVFQPALDQSSTAAVMRESLVPVLHKPEPRGVARLQEGFVNLWQTDRPKAAVYTAGVAVTGWTVGEMGLGVIKSTTGRATSIWQMFGAAQEVHGAGAGVRYGWRMEPGRKVKTWGRLDPLPGEAAVAHEAGTVARTAARPMRRLATRLLKVGGAFTAVLAVYDIASTDEEVKAAEREISAAVLRGEIDRNVAATATFFNQWRYLGALLPVDGVIGSLAEAWKVPAHLRPESFSDLPSAELPTKQHEGDVRYFTTTEILAVLKQWKADPASVPEDNPIRRFVDTEVRNSRTRGNAAGKPVDLDILITRMEQPGAHEHTMFGYAGATFRIPRPDPYVGRSYGYADLRNHGPLYQRLKRAGYSDQDIMALLKGNATGFWDGQSVAGSAAGFRMLTAPGVALDVSRPARLRPIDDSEWSAREQTMLLDAMIDNTRDRLLLRERVVSTQVEAPLSKLYDGYMEQVVKLIEAARAGGGEKFAKAQEAFHEYCRTQGISHENSLELLNLGLRLAKIAGGASDPETSRQAAQAVRQEFYKFILGDEKGQTIFAEFMRKQPQITFDEMLRLSVTPVFEKWAKSQYGDQAEQVVKEIRELALFEVRHGGGRRAWNEPGYFPPSHIMQRNVFWERIKQYDDVGRKFASYLMTGEGLSAHYEWLETTVMTQVENLNLLRNNDRATYQAMHLAFIPEENFVAELGRLGITDATQIAEIRALRVKLNEAIPASGPAKKLTVSEMMSSLWGSITNGASDLWTAYNSTTLPTQLPEGYDFQMTRERAEIIETLISMMNRVKAAPEFGKARQAAAVIPESGEVRRVAMVDERTRMLSGLVVAAGGVVEQPRVNLVGAQVVGSEIVALKEKLGFAQVADITGGVDVGRGSSVVARTQPKPAAGQEAPTYAMTSMFS